MSDPLTARPAVIAQLLAVDNTGTVANYIRLIEAALCEAQERLRRNPTDHLPHTVRDLAAALAAERQAREQAEQERDRLRAALTRYGQHEDGCPAWPMFPGHFGAASHVGECTCGLSAAALSPQDGQR